MNKPVYDVIVIGASLAGTSAALSFRKTGHSVLMLDKTRFPRQKVCGEFLSPSLWPWFEEMGLKEKILESGFHSVEKAVLYSPRGRTVKIQFEEPALGLSRYCLDQILLDTAKERGAVVKEGCLVTEKTQETGGWALKVIKSESNSAEIFYGRKVIDASGKPAVSRKKMKTENEMLGFQAHFENAEGVDHLLELYFFREGYGGIVRVESGSANACFLLQKKDVPIHLVPGNSGEFMKWVFERHPVLKEHMGHAVLHGDLHTTGALIYGLKTAQISGQNLINVGDALGVIDPFFGQGMTVAIQTGWMSGQCADAHEFALWVQKNLRQRFWLAKVLRKTVRYNQVLEMVFSILGRSDSMGQFLFKVAHGYG